MKIDKLIKQRSKQLDVESPPPEVWQAIQKEIRKPQQSTFQWWKVAAILFICFSIGLLIQNRLLQTKVDELASLGDLSEEYSAMEYEYLTQVSMLEETLPLDQIRAKAQYSWIFEELTTLEEINLMYRSDIGKVGNDQLVAALIDYYEKKLKLLKTLELEIERNSKQENNEKTDRNPIRI